MIGLKLAIKVGLKTENIQRRPGAGLSQMASFASS